MGRLFVLLVLAVGASTSCGDPGKGEDDEVFTFTPVPVYTVGGPGREGVLYSLTDECGVYVGDEVVVTVPQQDANRFESWLDAHGFKVRQAVDGLRGIRFLVEVPPGSVPDAVAFMYSQPEVILAAPNSIAAIPESTSVAEILKCEGRPAE